LTAPLSVGWGSPYVCEARYGTVADVLAHPFQPDGEYKISVGGRYFARDEFEAWAAH